MHKLTAFDGSSQSHNSPNTLNPNVFVPPLLCHRCGAVAQPVITESYQACGGRLSEATAHALIDHFLLIESELAQIRRLLLEEVGL